VRRLADGIADMFIAHANGHPVTIKTKNGGRFIAFASLADGQAFLRYKQSPCALNTLEEILRLNPSAFPPEFSVLFLPTREVIQNFATTPETFPAGEHLVTLKVG
jgi:hypothetical protein